MMTFLLNPGTRRRKGRRVRRSSRRRSFGRSHARRRHAKRRSHAKRSHRRTRRHGRRVARRTVSIRLTNPGRRRRRRSGRKGHRRYSHRRRNPVWAINRPRRRSRRGSRRFSFGRRRRNPGLGGMTRSLTHSPLSLLPISFGSGFIGNTANMIANSFAGGAVFLSGYMLSGAIVDYTIGPPSSGDDFKSKWGRPLAFASLAGLIGAGVAWVGGVLKLRNKGLVAALAAAGPGVRALGGIVKAFVDSSTLTAPGIIGDTARAATGMADFLQARQLADFFQAPQGMSGCDPDFDLDDSAEGGDANAMADAGLDEEGGDGVDVM